MLMIAAWPVHEPLAALDAFMHRMRDGVEQYDDDSVREAAQELYDRVIARPTEPAPAVATYNGEIDREALPQYTASAPLPKGK